jgi:LPXTG-motif cell wall-anchored protein
MPIGGAATGLGGTAPKPGTSPDPWLAIMAGGGLLAALGLIRLRRNRHRAAHAFTAAGRM